MKYPNLFQSYYPLKGKDWIRSIPQDDRRVFVDIGMQANDHGRLGGLAVLQKYGREHFARLAKIRHEKSKKGELKP